MTPSLRLPVCVLLLATTSSSLFVQNKVDAAACSKTGLRKAVNEVRYFIFDHQAWHLSKDGEFSSLLFVQATMVVMATAVEVRKAGGGMHPVVMQVNPINLDTFLARFAKLLSPTDTFRLRRITRAPLQWYHLVSNLFFSPLLHPPQATIFPPAHHRLLLQEPATSSCWAPEALWATPSCSSLHPRGWWGRAPWRGSRN